MGIVEESLLDIRARQNTLLYNRGELSDKQIEEIQGQVLLEIRQFHNKDEEIYMIFEKDDNELRQEIIKQYDNYLEQTRETEEKSFRDSLNVGISLEEQSDLAKQFIANTEQEKEKGSDKPKLLVDELPDLLL